MKKPGRLTAFLLVLMVVLTMFPATAFATTTCYMFVGQEGTMSMSGKVVPNAKWKTGNSSILKIVKQSKTSVITEGMKAGVARLTVYNSKNTSQKYTYTIKVLKEGKLVKQDFVFKRKSSGESIDILDWFLRDTSSTRFIVISNLNDYENYRGLRNQDTYSKVCARYGKKTLKKTTANDPLYGNALWQNNFEYYVTYSYDSHYKIRMYFNSNKQLVGMVCGKNKY
jgi:hypothetical protein